MPRLVMLLAVILVDLKCNGYRKTALFLLKNGAKLRQNFQITKYFLTKHLNYILCLYGF